MWLLVVDEYTMDILAKKEVRCGDCSQWAIDLNDDFKEFKPLRSTSKGVSAHEG
jgi:hypothetical protein